MKTILLYHNNQKFADSETVTKIAKFHSVMKYLVFDGPFMSAADKKWYQQKLNSPFNFASIEYTAWEARIIDIHVKMIKKLKEILENVFPSKRYHLSIETLTVNNLSDNFNEEGKRLINDYVNPSSKHKPAKTMLSYCSSTTKFGED